MRPSARAALAALAILSMAGRASGDAQVELAIQALKQDRSLKVRAQAAIVLGQRGAPEAVPALREAAERDPEAAVRLAAVSALARIGDDAARVTLEAVRTSDRDARVRDAAGRAVAALAAPGPIAFSIEATSGSAGNAAAREALRDSLARHLRSRGYHVVEGDARYRLKPSLLVMDVDSAGGKTTIAVKASLVAVDRSGRMAAMLEGGARLKASGSLPEGSVDRYAAKAVEAAAKTLGDDLAARLE